MNTQGNSQGSHVSTQTSQVTSHVSSQNSQQVQQKAAAAAMMMSFMTSPQVGHVGDVHQWTLVETLQLTVGVAKVRIEGEEKGNRREEEDKGYI